MSKTLIIMVGLPRSGKSTRAHEISKSHRAPIVNPDSIRMALHGHAFIASAEPFVWAVAKTMVRALFYSHDIVVLDACSHTKARRSEWRSTNWKRMFVSVETDPQICIARADGNEALIAAINRMAVAQEPVGDDETD